MKIKFFNLVVLGFIVLASCNKDDEIIIENPDTPEETPFSDNFSVIEFLPGPGQYVNDTNSGYGDVTTMDEACEYAKTRLDNVSYVSLGAWGGYIVVKSNKPINNTGNYDFSIAGNSFDTSNEPGIVWVMQDKNGNGQPDDIWYELKGSYYGKDGFEKDFWVTYYRPETSKQPTTWVASNGETGSIQWLGSYHSQDYYYPLWVNEASYTLHGTRLPSQSVQDSNTGNWSNLPFEWGYVDNSGEDSELTQINDKTVLKNFFKISDAVDSNGNAINLTSIDFIKVQTAILSNSGWLGENSTEVMGFFIEN